MKYFILLLFSLCTFSQIKPLSFKIDHIHTVDSSAVKRIYTITYHIENLTDKPVSFVLNTTRTIPIQRGSQSEMLYFKIVENESTVEMERIFESTFKNTRIPSKTYTDKTPEEVDKIQQAEYMAFFKENGKVQQVGYFKDGKLDGKWTSYDVNGNIKAVAEYTNGEKSGKWMYFSNNVTTAEVDYSSNNIVAIKNFKQNSVAVKN